MLQFCSILWKIVRISCLSEISQKKSTFTILQIMLHYINMLFF